MNAEAPARLGHNQPPLAERLPLEYGEFERAVEAFGEWADRLPEEVESDEDDARVAQVVAEASLRRREIDAKRKEVLRPYLDAQKDVNGYFNRLLRRLDNIATNLNGRLTTWKRRKADEERKRQEEIARKNREEAERLRRESDDGDKNAGPMAAYHDQRAKDADLEAARPAADVARVKTDQVTSSAKEFWNFEVEDIGKIDLNELRPFFTDDEILKAVRAYVREHEGSRPLAGVRIFRDVKASVRGR